MKTLYKNGNLYTPQGVISDGWLLVGSDGRIEAIGSSRMNTDNTTVVYDLKGRKVLPGFIDVHIHGSNGFDVMQATYNSLDEISRSLAKTGTTSFLATTTTSSQENILRALECVAASKELGVTGAELLGIHLEGPFINEKRRGAQNRNYIRQPNLAELEQFLQSSKQNIKLVTLAPEAINGSDAVRFLTSRGITVSIGHSDATYEEVLEAVQLGINHTTHHFNGMSPLHHREPGVAGAGLLMPSLTTELICDGVHVHPAVVKLLFDIKTEWCVCLITDSVACAGLPDGEYESVKVTNGEIYLKDGSTLAGSSLSMIQALKNMMKFTGYPLEKILPSLTIVPSRQIKMDNRKGSLEVGKDADFLIVTDDLCIQSTFVKGREVYKL